MFSTYNRKNNAWRKHIIPSYKYVNVNSKNKRVIEVYKQVYAELFEFMKNIVAKATKRDYIFTDWDQISICEKFYFDRKAKKHKHNFKLIGEGYYPIAGCVDCGHCDGSHLFTSVIIEFSDYDNIKSAYVIIYNKYMDSFDMTSRC